MKKQAIVNICTPTHVKIVDSDWDVTQVGIDHLFVFLRGMSLPKVTTHLVDLRKVS